MTFNHRPILDAIHRAANEAAARGVTVKVEIHETGFFATERLDVTITATPEKGGTNGQR